VAADRPRELRGDPAELADPIIQAVSALAVGHEAVASGRPVPGDDARDAAWLQVSEARHRLVPRSLARLEDALSGSETVVAHHPNPHTTVRELP